jgi:hypothetical protein
MNSPRNIHQEIHFEDELVAHLLFLDQSYPNMSAKLQNSSIIFDL